MQKKKKDWETLRDTGIAGSVPAGGSLAAGASLRGGPTPVFGYGALGVPGPAGAQTGDGDRREGVPYRLGLPGRGEPLFHPHRQTALPHRPAAAKRSRWSMSSRWTLGSRCGILWLPYRLAREKEAAKDEGKPESEIQHPLWPAQPGGRTPGGVQLHPQPAPAAGAVRPGKRVSEHPVPGGRWILGDQLRAALVEEDCGDDRKWAGGDLDCQGPQPSGAGNTSRWATTPRSTFPRRGCGSSR